MLFSCQQMFSVDIDFCILKLESKADVFEYFSQLQREVRFIRELTTAEEMLIKKRYKTDFLPFPLYK